MVVANPSRRSRSITNQSAVTSQAGFLLLKSRW
nr:MAG TPA: hypothetical protein [Caudoviricetes sp.]